MLATSISTELDFNRMGRQIGALKLAHSDDRYCFGVIPIPIATIANGEGPTLLLTAGNHGDEYEGQVVLRRLIQELDPSTIRGRVIIIPALNYPAVQAQARVSPLDGANLNRSFPGSPDASPTQAIAHYVGTVIMPMCDAGIDFHSGGKSAEYLPSAFLSTHPDQALTSQMLDMIDAFGAPHTLILDGTAIPSSLDVYAQNQHGIPLICTEAGGQGSVNPAIVRMKTRGIYRVLKHLGMIDDHQHLTEPEQTRYMSMAGSGCFMEAPIAGLFEPCCQLGEQVKAGQPAGCIYALDEPERPAVEITFEYDGLIVGRRVSTVVERSMFTFNIATEITREQAMKFSAH